MNKIKILSVCLLLVLFLLMFSSSSSAYILIGGRFSRGVSNTCYYVDSTASAYTSRINAAANNWVNTGHGYNPIYMTAVSSSYLTHIDLYGRSSSYFYNPSRTLASTRMYTNNSVDITAQTSTTNWFYAEININTNLLATNTNDAQGTLAHEMGHCFGLNENNTVKNSIMCQTSSGRTVYRVGVDDHNGINAIY